MILFEDENFVALDKPPGLSMATPPGRQTEAAGRLAEAAGFAAGVPLWLVHRLDAGTSGVVLLAKNSEAHRRASLLFQERRILKVYVALVWGHPSPAAGTIDLPLSLDREDRRRMRVVAEGKRAVTRYETRDRLQSVALLELRPETGRTHQLRVHLAHRGHPIVGDDLYGGPRWRGVRTPRLRSALERVGRLCLHARDLEFSDPFRGREVRICAPEPAEFAALSELARIRRVSR